MNESIQPCGARALKVKPKKSRILRYFKLTFSSCPFKMPKFLPFSNAVGESKCCRYVSHIVHNFMLPNKLLSHTNSQQV
ncbi:hypothetical protein ACLKA7_004087 [Drosophila subpalustris]